MERFRLPALHYRRLLEALQAEGTRLVDQAPAFAPLLLVPALEMTPYPHQRAALAAWLAAGRRGVVVLPTGAGKTYPAQLALQATQQSTLIVVPTLDLMHQWYAHLLAAFPDMPVGLLGGGAHDRTPLLVATYDSAAIHADALGNHYALLIFDECHHLSGAFTRVIAEYALAPYRLPDGHPGAQRRHPHRPAGPDWPRSLPHLGRRARGHRPRPASCGAPRRPALAARAPAP